MEQKKKKGYGAGIVTGILATVLVSLLLLGGFRVITNTAGSYVSGKVTEKEVSKKLNKLNALMINIICMKMKLIQISWQKEFIPDIRVHWEISTLFIMMKMRQKL